MVSNCQRPSSVSQCTGEGIIWTERAYRNAFHDTRYAIWALVIVVGTRGQWKPSLMIRVRNVSIRGIVKSGAICHAIISGWIMPDACRHRFLEKKWLTFGS